MESREADVKRKSQQRFDDWLAVRRVSTIHDSSLFSSTSFASGRCHRRTMSDEEQQRVTSGKMATTPAQIPKVEDTRFASRLTIKYDFTEPSVFRKTTGSFVHSSELVHCKTSLH